jgi:hypothetical protein
VVRAEAGAGVARVAELLTTTTTRGLAGVTCGIRLGFTIVMNRLPMFKAATLELIRLTIPVVVVAPDVLVALPPIDPVMVTELVAVDGAFILTGMELGMFIDDISDLTMGVGFAIDSMTGLGDAMDSKCRDSSGSTESSAFEPVLRAVIVRRCCS